MGYYPVTDQPYDQNYWDKYVGYAKSEMGRKITEARIKWVNQWASGLPVVDVGIGCGHFIEERVKTDPTLGFDINPVGVRWLEDRSLLVSPYETEVDAVSFWDVIEHIHNPEPLLRNVRQYVFASIPIFRDASQVLTSKHFRKDEHCWYWTARSFPTFMGWFGFDFIGASRFETDLGREDIMTFSFKRK